MLCLMALDPGNLCNMIYKFRMEMENMVKGGNACGSEIQSC